MSEAPRYHSFTRLTLTVHEPSLAGVRTDHQFELRGCPGGAEVWRASAIHGPGGVVESDWRYIGSLSSRRVIDLLEEIRRSGIYEALPALGIVPGEVDAQTQSRVSMELGSDEGLRSLLSDVPQDASLVSDLVRMIRRAIEQAQEDALTSAG